MNFSRQKNLSIKVFISLWESFQISFDAVVIQLLLDSFDMPVPVPVSVLVLVLVLVSVPVLVKSVLKLVKLELKKRIQIKRKRSLGKLFLVSPHKTHQTVSTYCDEF